MKEVDLQKKLKDAVNAHGGHALKASSQFLIGVPDLSVKMRGLPHAYVEVKLEDWPKQVQQIKNNATPLQKKFLRDYQAADGVGLIAVFSKKGNTWHLAISNQIFRNHFPLEEFTPLAPWGRTDDLCTILAMAIQSGTGFRPTHQLLLNLGTPWLPTMLPD